MSDSPAPKKPEREPPPAAVADISPEWILRKMKREKEANQGAYQQGGQAAYRIMLNTPLDDNGSFVTRVVDLTPEEVLDVLERRKAAPIA